MLGNSLLAAGLHASIKFTAGDRFSVVFYKNKCTPQSWFSVFLNPLKPLLHHLYCVCRCHFQLGLTHAL